MPETRTLTVTQQKALDALVAAHGDFADAWDAQQKLSGHRLTAVARCRDLKISAEQIAAATRDAFGARGLSAGRVHQFYMQLDGHQRYKSRGARDE